MQQAHWWDPLTEIPAVFWIVLLMGISGAIVTYFPDQRLALFIAMVLLAVAKAAQVAWKVHLEHERILEAHTPEMLSPGRNYMLVDTYETPAWRRWLLG